MMGPSPPGLSIKIDIDRKVNFYNYFKDELKTRLLKKKMSMITLKIMEHIMMNSMSFRFR